nr:DUF3073 domain-containing protein [Neoactinobaculum massilliense]
MGRGRQKAKQRKVARNLKYYAPETDYEALERELRKAASEHKHEDDADYSEGADYSDSVDYSEDDEYTYDPDEVPPATDE